MKSFKSKMMIRLDAAAIACTLPATAQAQLFFNDPNFDRGPIEPGDPLVGIELPGATAAEARAGLVWNLRAGLNAAALQCQFSRYLRSVDNYNAVLAHHSGELASAYSAVGNYFRRVHGQREGQLRFDRWNTTTYQNFSSLYGQLGFCQVASDVAKEALTRRKGEFVNVARDRMRELRSALRPAGDRLTAQGSALVLQPLPPTLFSGPNCAGLRGRDLQRCRAS